jgi:gliding motility-associated lipoprotein GldH
MLRTLQFSISLLLSFILLSCNNNRLFEEVQSIDNSGWEKSDVKKFTIAISDTATAYDIFLHLRNKTTYDNSNLWLFVNTSAPNGDKITDTLEFMLADPSGHWLGKGLGSINSMLIPYKINIRFPYRGIYTFEFQQGMRDDVLEGIIDIGMRVQSHK